jgi:anti-sigma regulatory factor (Ser/Thr protein kinase)
MTLQLHASPEEVMRAVEALQEYARTRGIPERTAFGLALALEECGSNIVNHALRGDAQRTFQVAFALKGDVFNIELRDSGPPFDPTTAASRELKAADDDTPGGWGIQLVRHYIDDIRYTREQAENVLRLTKRLTLPPGTI